ncbi:MAG: hypothetical protein IPN06_10845 [Burkholderiales bacterium]|nr:hypothetical protein [Burkholderiales bacterium]
MTRWEDSNSRADVVIEDVRIGNSQKTSDVTIAMVETDPGNVDFGLYFDQLSLRNASSSSSSLTINIMDSGAAANAATAATPLLNNPYDTFKLGVNGVLTTIALDKTAVAAADTYEALLAVFNTALTGSGVVANLWVPTSPLLILLPTQRLRASPLCSAAPAAPPSPHPQALAGLTPPVHRFLLPPTSTPPTPAALPAFPSW